MANGKGKPDIKNHFQYRVWVYLVIAVIGWFAADLLYTATEYRPPAERKVEFQLVQGGYMETEALEAAVAPQALLEGQAYDDTLEAVAFYSIAYSGDGSQDVYGAQKYVVMVAAQEGDVYILPRVLFEQMHAQGGLMPLDDLAAKGLIDTAGLDLTGCVLPEPSDEMDEEGVPLPANGEEHLYGLPAAGIKGLDEAGYATQDAYLVIMGYCKNPETTAVVMRSVMEQLKDGLPQKEDAA